MAWEYLLIEGGSKWSQVKKSFPSLFSTKVNKVKIKGLRFYVTNWIDENDLYKFVV